MAIKEAQNARAVQHLAQFISTSAYGICTRAQRLEQAVAAGCTLEAAEVRDEARERKIERELQQMRGNGRVGSGVPTGNECHPRTIAYNKLKAELASGPKTVEYRLHRPDGSYWNVLTKTEFEYAKGLINC